MPVGCGSIPPQNTNEHACWHSPDRQHCLAAYSCHEIEGRSAIHEGLSFIQKSNLVELLSSGQHALAADLTSIHSFSFPETMSGAKVKDVDRHQNLEKVCVLACEGDL